MGDREVIQAIFREHVFGFIFSDIKREIILAKNKEGKEWRGPGPDPEPGGGNLLAALGLLCYTEFLGSFMTGKREGNSRKNFESFFAELGPCYKAFAASHDVYNIFRNGLVHEYTVKQRCTIAMFSGPYEPCGIAKNGNYLFVVERYFNDFTAAARRLYDGLLQKPVLPK